VAFRLMTSYMVISYKPMASPYAEITEMNSR
jgi:hypothetical protein